ncbi:MAG: isopenicillin N synthase family oxygenase [Telmatospirillum sp.]|nr:isopenicillin N synthase family oxygenase [Telmatospirillum sp.]
MDLPLIDISAFRTRDQAAMQVIARDVDRACRDVGFLVVRGHDIPQALFDRSFELTRRYFARGTDEKLRDCSPSPDVFRGYERMGTRYRDAGPAGKKVADYKEAYMISSPDFDEAERRLPVPHGFEGMYAPNIWPNEAAGDIQGFRTTFVEFYRAVDALARTMNGVFAAALQLPEDFFVPHFTGHASTCTWVNYPAQTVPPEPGQMRIPEHTDSTSLTVVVQDGSAHGLEIKTRDGKWIPVRSPEGAVVINLGDLMAQWTNDRWVSTPHRVDNPPREIAMANPRYSLCFFQKPHVDASIECLPTCTDAANPVRHAPIQAGAYIRQKMLRTRPQPSAAE